MAETILVVVPTRDRPAMLAEALDSVAAQTDQGWRCVVADDGDGRFVRDLLPPRFARDPRFAFCRCATRTAGGARNAATEHGEARVLGGPAPLLAYLDDDDLWLPDHLARSREALGARPDAVFVHGAAVTRSAGGETSYHAKDRGPFEGPLFVPLLRRDFVATSSVVARGDAVRAVGGFRADVRHAQDWDLWLALARRGPAAFVREATVVYRDHGGNVSRDLVTKISDQTRVLEPWWARRGELAPAERRALRRELARRHRRHVRRLRLEGSTDRAALRALARTRWREVPHAHTAAARLGAALLPLGRGR